MNYLATSHDPTLVGISWIVAIFAAFAVLSTLDRLRRSPTHRRAWLLGGAVAFGFGVWAMHFTGMTAMSIDRIVTYDPALTALSVVFAFLGSWAAFSLMTTGLKTGDPAVARILAAGTLLGAGIGAMHYTGMFAMRMNAALGFDLPTVGASVVVAVVICSFGLWMMTSHRFDTVGGRTLIVSAVVGSAIPLLHYVGMAAARFTALPASSEIDVLSSSGVSLSLNFFLVLAILVLSFPLFLNALFPASDARAEAYEL